ncbi:unnamed protein product [Symbiodinium sp. CCMP2456]|nr:unnamed protein product [Symbiodinium sp. CCMP2456]
MSAAAWLAVAATVACAQCAQDAAFCLEESADGATHWRREKEMSCTSDADMVWLLQTGFDVGDEASSSFRDQLSLPADSVAGLRPSDAAAGAARYEQMLEAETEPRRHMDEHRMEVVMTPRLRALQVENEALRLRLMSKDLSHKSSSTASFNDWCLANSDVVVGFSCFLITCVIVSLCIPCGMSPLQLCLGAMQGSASGEVTSKL